MDHGTTADDLGNPTSGEEVCVALEEAIEAILEDDPDRAIAILKGIHDSFGDALMENADADGEGH